MIAYHTQTGFELRDPDKYTNWINNAIRGSGFIEGELNYIFCSDDQLLEVNQKFLAHDDYTDIITFDYSEGQLLNGDIFISVERVHENSETYSVPFEEELRRVMIHGVLHLMGMEDKSPEDKAAMRAREEALMQMFHVKPYGDVS